MDDNYQTQDAVPKGISPTEMMLTPDIPEEEFQKYKSVYMLFNKNMKLGYIYPSWVGVFLRWFEVIKILHKLEMFDEARDIITKLNAWIAVSSSIQGFSTLCQTGAIQIGINKMLGEVGKVYKKRGLLDKLAQGSSSYAEREYEYEKNPLPPPAGKRRSDD